MFAEADLEGRLVASAAEVAGLGMASAALQAAADVPERTFDRIRSELGRLGHEHGTVG
jgi:hypothetical protein